MRFLKLWRRGGSHDVAAMQLVLGWLGACRSPRPCPSWARCARLIPRLLHPRCARWRGMLFGSPKPSGGKIGVAAFLLAAENVRYHC